MMGNSALSSVAFGLVSAEPTPRLYNRMVEVLCPGITGVLRNWPSHCEGGDRL